MQVSRTLVVRGGAVVVLLLLGWLALELVPERQLWRAQERLLKAASDRNWKKAGDFLAEDYRDQWGHDRAQALELAEEAFGHFLVLNIRADRVRISRSGDEGLVETRVRVTGRGSALAQMLMDRVNSLEDDFQFAWKRKSWKPWDWKLVFISHDEIDPMEMP